MHICCALLLRIPAVHSCCAFLLCILAKQSRQCTVMTLSCCVLQLLNWYKRRHSPVDGCRLYRLAPHCAAAPTYLVLKAVPQPQLTSLDPRGIFMAHCQDELYLWQVGCIVWTGHMSLSQYLAFDLLSFLGLPCSDSPSGCVSDLSDSAAHPAYSTTSNCLPPAK